MTGFDTGHDEVFAGRFFDGKDATEHFVTVEMAGAGLEFTLPATEEFFVWSYEGLRAVTPLTGASTARLSHDDSPQARLHVDDFNFAKTITQRAPQLSKGAETRQTATIVGTAIAFLVVAGALIFGILNYAPRMVAGFVPDSIWRTLGSTFEGQMTAGAKQCINPKGVKALETMTNRLLSANGERDRPITVSVFALDQVNAFAMAGGRVVIGAKLIELNDGPDELAGVLAHEIGHVIEAHPEAALVRVFGLQFLLGLIVGGSSDFAQMLANLGGMAALMSYSRDAERAADERGQTFLENSEIDPTGLKRFFEAIHDIHQPKDGKAKTAKPARKPGTLENIMSSHPGSAERIAAIRANPEANYRPALTQAQWAALKDICK